ncbi:hypothetical protein FE257_010700 [Aspergillus nanangensis]|uniref:Major facilitator superfamily (MFS) profile domain-containing protein n=1 Tax=Aspergillus nanangensis TaxID=2582783 RepID=A0AAD4CI46_ASPNN|nr:hypothetical protein FE257_010700 [Aspergillus nanangensis]
MEKPVAMDKSVEKPNVDIIANEALGSSIPPGYYTSWGFLGSTTAIAVGCISGYGGWLLAASSLQRINEDLGPSPDALWMPMANTLGSAVGMFLFGRLSDIFGRRWPMLLSNVIVLIGSVTAATTTSIHGIIAANALIGIGSAALLSYAITLAELIPYKARGYVSCVIFITAMPTNAFGPIVAKSFIAHTRQTWRWAYYLNIITTGCALLLFAVFYHPPTFAMLHVGQTKRRRLLSLDYGGLFLLVAGLVLFLLGLNWGGQMYPWGSARVIATITIGICTLVALVIYEFTVPRDPILPPSILKNQQCMVLIGVASIGGMVYYGMSVFWPEMVSTLFTDDLEEQGWLTMTATAGAALGNIVAGATFQLGKFRWQLVAASALMTTFFGAMASVDQHTRERGIAFTVLGTFFAGWLEGPTMAAITYAVDQADIGLIAGLLNAIRVCMGGVAVAIYNAALDNKKTHLLHKLVPDTAQQMGLPSSSISAVFDALEQGLPVSAVPGMNETTEVALSNVAKNALAGACQLVFEIIIALDGLALIASFFVHNVDQFLTSEVSRRLHSFHTKQQDEESEVCPANEGD